MCDRRVIAATCSQYYYSLLELGEYRKRLIIVRIPFIAEDLDIHMHVKMNKILINNEINKM